MSQLAVANAIKARWNAAGLDTTIASLHPGNIGSTGKTGMAGGSTGSRATGGAAPGTTLPRAEYVMQMDRELKRSRGSRAVFQPVRFQVWGSVFTTVAGYVDAIRDAFVNSEQAATSPFSIASNTVLAVNDGGGAVLKQDDTIFQGIQIIEVEYRKANTVPE